MEFTATEPTWWIAHGEDVRSGFLPTGASLTTGAEFFETFADQGDARVRLREIRADPREARRSGAPTEPFARLAWARWSLETGGLDIPGGRRIITTRESQSQLGSVFTSLNLGLISEPVAYKLESGWVDLTTAEVSAIAQAVGNHVKACFRAERTAMAQLEAMENPDSANVEGMMATAYAEEVSP